LKYFHNRFNILKKRKVKAELIYTFAFGIFINAFYSITKESDLYDFIDIILSSVGIVEGIYLKYKE